MTDSVSDGTPAYPHDEPSTPTLDRPDVLAGEALAAPPRQERSRRSREALIAAARSRFASNGYDATAVEDVAKDAGVAVGGFYLHFRSKRQVLLVLVDRLVQELDAEPWSTPGDDSATIMDRIRARFSTVFRHGGVYRALSEATSRDPFLAVLRKRIDAWALAGITAALNAAAASPRARPNVDVATVSYMLSVVFWTMLDAGIADRAALSDTLVTALRHVFFEDAAADRRS
jgi:AcrR family transcriptional regulator